MNRFAISSTLTLVIVAASCSGDGVVNPDDTGKNTADSIAGFTISNIVQTGLSASHSAAARAASGIAYVSAAPSSFDDRIHSVVIRNESSGDQPVKQIVFRGGFDPVAIKGEPDDRVSVSLLERTGDAVSVLYTKIPARRPPVVVRTVPAKGRVDVALNTVIEIVFSEPIDMSSLTSNALRLTSGGLQVNGTLSLSPDGLIASITPSSALAPSADHEVTLATEIRDLDGDRLVEPQVIDFRTGSDAPVVPQPLRNGLLAFVSDRDGNAEIYTSNPDGTESKRLTNNSVGDFSPAWSPDGTKIAFVRGEYTWRYDLKGNIYVMNADGSNVTQLTTAGIHSAPAWSPSGKQIAFAQNAAGGSSVRLMIIDAEEPARNPREYGEAFFLNFLSHPQWSPDGQYIIFESDYGSRLESRSSVYRVPASGLDAPPQYIPLGAPISGGPLAEITEEYPSFSRDGSRIAFAYCDFFYLCTGTGSIATANWNGTGLTFLKTVEDVDGVSWSPDGSMIAYSSRGCRTCPTPSIYYVSADGSANGVLISNAYMPAWQGLPR